MVPDQKGQVQSWNKIVREKAVKAKLKMIWQRMPDFAISDNFYDRFYQRKSCAGIPAV